MKNKNGKLESSGKAKSRIKTFEKHLECGHRLALTYASNQPGETPKIVQDAQYDSNVIKAVAKAGGVNFDAPVIPGRMWPSGRKPSASEKKHDAEVRKSMDYYKLKGEGRKGED